MSFLTRSLFIAPVVVFALVTSGLPLERRVRAQEPAAPSPTLQRVLTLVEQGDLSGARAILDGVIGQSTGDTEKNELTVALGLLTAKTLLFERDFPGALRQSRTTLAGSAAAPALLGSLLEVQSMAYEGLGEPRLARGAMFIANFLRQRKESADWGARCGSLEASEPIEPGSLDALRERVAILRACLKDDLSTPAAYAKAYSEQTTAPPTEADFAIVMLGNVFEPLLLGLFDAFTETIEAPKLEQEFVLGSAFARMIAKMTKTLAASGAGYSGAQHIFDAHVEGLFLAGRNALVIAAADRWKKLSAVLPTLSDQQRRALMALAAPTDVEKAVSLTFEFPGAGAADGFRTALLTKQLLSDTSRHANARMQEALTHARREWRERWQTKERLRQQYAQSYISAIRESETADVNDEARRARQAEVMRLSREIDDLEGELRKTNTVYAEQASSNEVTVDQVRGALRPNEALIEYVTYEPYAVPPGASASTRQFGAFVVRGGSAGITAIPLGDGTPVTDAVAGIRGSMRRFIDSFVEQQGSSRRERTPHGAELVAREREFAERSSALRSRIWSPLENALAGATRVYIAPVADLSLIPFETLATKTLAGWHYLIEDREIVYLGTGRDLARLTMNPLARREGAQRTAVLIGDPRFSASPQEIADTARARLGPERFASVPAARSSLLLGAAPSPVLPTRLAASFSPEPGLRASVDATNALLQRLGWASTAYTGASASELVALSVAAPDLLQFLTHGVALGAEPTASDWDNPLLRSMLILAGANVRPPGNASDGVLTAYEVAGMNLYGTRLVNLTACETGLGDVTPEGVAGLRQAFLLAGARAVTVSLWQLPTKRTIIQMSRFYTLWLGRGLTPYGAMRQAQRESLAEARRQYGSGHPFYWAGVVFLGDPGDLAAPPRS